MQDVASDQFLNLNEILFAFGQLGYPVTLFNRSVTTCPSLCKGELYSR